MKTFLLLFNIFQCEYCSRRFAQGNDLKSHVRRHTGERYACDMCDASFIQTYLLNHHKKDAHGVNMPPIISRLAKFEPPNGNVNVLPMDCPQSIEKVPTECFKNEC